MGLKFIHTADWQLGKRFRWIPGDAAALVREQRLATIAHIGEIAIERNADAVLVAGDVFDMNTVETTTLRRLCDCLNETTVHWLLLPGNHDPALPESAWTRMKRLGIAEHVHLLTTPTPFQIPGTRAFVLPAPLTAAQTPSDITAYFDDVTTPEGFLRIGLAHGSVTNRLPSSSDAKNPIADTRVRTASLDYLALGDWHGALRIAERTWYSGTPEPDRFRDNQSGHVLFVELTEPGAPPSVQTIRTGHYHWHTLEHELLEPRDLDALDAALAAVSEEPSRAIVSLQLKGHVSLQRRMEVNALLGKWAARFRHLKLVDQLHAKAVEEDLRSLAQQGYLAHVVKRLRAISDDPAHADAPHADRALQILHATYQASSSK